MKLYNLTFSLQTLKILKYLFNIIIKLYIYTINENEIKIHVKFISGNNISFANTGSLSDSSFKKSIGHSTP